MRPEFRNFASMDKKIYIYTIYIFHLNLTFVTDVRNWSYLHPNMADTEIGKLEHT